MELSERAPGALGMLGLSYGLAGKKTEATKILNELLELNKSRYVTPAALANVYIGLGDKDKAFVWLEKAYQKVSERFHAELGKKHGLKPAEIEICLSIATEDLGDGINLKSITTKDQSFSNVNAVEGAS